VTGDSEPIRMGPTFEQDWPGASSRATECVMNLMRTADELTERIAAILRPYALTPAAAQVLSIIHGAGEPLPQHVIGERMVASRGTVSWLVDGLERRGLVRRLPHPSSRRTVLVEITESAEQLLITFRPAIHALDRASVADLSDEEQDTLVELLGRIQAQLRVGSACDAGGEQRADG
jgi:MarR family 2-MHQ and catechol resistance regulon transcriptional repressor